MSNKREEMKIFAVFKLTLLLVGLIRMSQGYIEGYSALKVSNIVPPDCETCFLEEFEMAIKSSSGCLSLCAMNPSCIFVCKIGKKCRLYKANVALFWNDISSQNPELLDATCFSFWAEHKDLAFTATFTSSQLFSSSVDTNLLREGYSCCLLNSYSCGTAWTFNPWYMADLGTSLMVDRVVVQVRQFGLSPFFQDVEVRVGDEAGNGDFTGNELLMRYIGGNSNGGHIVTFKREKPLKGRYVSIQSVLDGSSYLVVVEMKILPL